jgi:hypothetical protein
MKMMNRLKTTLNHWISSRKGFVLMHEFRRKQLTVFLLLVMVLLVPFNSFARDMTSGVSKNTCACHLLPTDCSTDEKEDQPDHGQVDNDSDCCDSGDCCPDAAESTIPSDLKVNISGRQLICPNTIGNIPKVYLTILVPPAN